MEYVITEGANSTFPHAEPALEVRRLHPSDLPQVDAIATHEAVWPHISNSSSPPQGEFTLASELEYGGNYFLGVYLDDKLVGYWMMLARSNDILEAHTCMLPEARGRIVTAALPLALHYLFERTPALTLVTHVPYTNPAALKLSKWAGFKHATTIPNGWTRDGATCDVDVLYLGWMDWLFGQPNNIPTKALHLIEALAGCGYHAKSSFLYHHLTTLLGDLTGDT